MREAKDSIEEIRSSSVMTYEWTKVRNMSMDFCPVAFEPPTGIENPMTRRFYDALKDALDVTGWSISKLCLEAGVSKDQITKFMQRAAKDLHATTNVDDAKRIANALGFTLDEMLGDDTAVLRSEAAALWRSLEQGERDLLLAAARGRRV